MHSLGMSMVRERSVKSFLERIQTRKFNVDIPYNPTSTSTLSATASGSAGTVSGSGTGLSNDTFLPPPKSAIGWLELRKGFHTMLCEDGNLLIFRDGVISSSSSSPQAQSQSQSLSQVKIKDTSVSGVNSPSVSPCSSPTTAKSHPHQSPQKWGSSSSAGSALDRIMTEIDAEEKEDQGTFLTIQTSNKEDSSTSASIFAKSECAQTQTISSNQYGGPINAHGTVPPSHHWDDGIKFLISSLRDTSITQTIAIGSWRIVISIITAERAEEHSLIDETSHGINNSEKNDNEKSSPTKKIEKNSDSTGTDSERILQSVRTLLDGHFVYHLNVPENCTYLSVPSAHMESGSSSSKSSTKDSKKARCTYCTVL